MHADLMLLYLFYLWIMISTMKKSWAKLLSVSLPSSFRDHPGLAKYHAVWATFSRFLLDTFSLACAIWIASAYVSVTNHCWYVLLLQYFNASTVPLNYNFICPYMETHGNTTWVRGILWRVCVDHVLDSMEWTCLVLCHAWNSNVRGNSMRFTHMNTVTRV